MADPPPLNPLVADPPVIDPFRFDGRGLACWRGGRMVFVGLDFSVSPGEILLLRGGNGSGKTSLLRLMAGLSVPVAGVLSWGDGPVDRHPRRHRARIAHIGHGDGLIARQTVGETLSFWAGVHDPRQVRRRVGLAVEACRLARLADTPVHLLSAGQRRRVALARLFVAPAHLWLLDEPLVNLDAGAAGLWRGQLRDHLARGGAAIIASHDDDPTLGGNSINLDRFAAGAADRPEATAPLEWPA